MKYQYLLFDADDTLFDFQKSERNALEISLNKLGIEYSDEVLATYKKINHGLWKNFEDGVIEKAEIQKQRFPLFLEAIGHGEIDGKVLGDEFIQNLAKGSFLLEGALPLCEKLAKHAKLYLITNGFSFVQHSRYDVSEVKQYFSGIFVSEDSGYQKPQKEYFDYVFDRIEEFDKEQALIIGDSLSSDIKGGMNVGIDTCWYNPNHLKKGDEYLCTYEVDDLKDIEIIVEGKQD